MKFVLSKSGSGCEKLERDYLNTKKRGGEPPLLIVLKTKPLLASVDTVVSASVAARAARAIPRTRAILGSPSSC